jgi:hypothetical protein
MSDKRRPIDLQINSIIEDMYQFTEEHPDWNAPQATYKPSDRISVQRCGRFPLCRNYCLGEEYERYGFCSPKCDSLADAESDRIQQDT